MSISSTFIRVGSVCTQERNVLSAAVGTRGMLGSMLTLLFPDLRQAGLVVLPRALHGEPFLERHGLVGR